MLKIFVKFVCDGQAEFIPTLAFEEASHHKSVIETKDEVHHSYLNAFYALFLPLFSPFFPLLLVCLLNSKHLQQVYRLSGNVFKGYFSCIGHLVVTKRGDDENKLARCVYIEEKADSAISDAVSYGVVGIGHNLASLELADFVQSPGFLFLIHFIKYAKI